MPRMLSLLASSFIGASIYAIGAQVGLGLGLGDVSSVTWKNLSRRYDMRERLTGSWWTFIPTGEHFFGTNFDLT